MGIESINTYENNTNKTENHTYDYSFAYANRLKADADRIHKQEAQEAGAELQEALDVVETTKENSIRHLVDSDKINSSSAVKTMISTARESISKNNPV